MKILFPLTAACMLVSASAWANVNVDIGIGVPVAEPVYAPQPQGYVLAPDWPSLHYDRHRHFHNDYWAHRQAEERGEHERR
jgi:hypothetical protein